MTLYLLFWDGIIPPNNEHAIESQRPEQKKEKDMGNESVGSGTFPSIPIYCRANEQI